MAVWHGVLTPGTTGTILSSVSGSPGDRMRQVFISGNAANAGVMYVGNAITTLSTTVYGFRIEVPTSSIPDPPMIIEGSTSLVSLAEIKVLAVNTTDKAHIFAISA